MSINSIDLIKAIDVLSSISPELRYDKICEMSFKKKQEYTDLLNQFEDANQNKRTSKAHKGKVLEDIVVFLLKNSGDLFHVDRNLRTSTNEIDQFLTLTPNGKILCRNGLIDSKLEYFLCECKNYHTRVGVTYVGKFCSLLITTQTLLGILFSYHGITGSGWNCGTGLIKKFYLHKENQNERYCVLDFNIKDFKKIQNGENILQLISEKLLSLRLDTDYSTYLSKHPAE